MVSRAAYLLFYRRRSSVPLGGSRFQAIVDRFETPEDDGGDSGEDQRLVVGSSLLGSSSAGMGAVATRQTRQSSATDARGLEPLPPYSSSMVLDDTIQSSIEDEGVGMSSGRLRRGSGIGAAMPTQWTWKLPDSNFASAAGALLDYRSDDAQHDSSGDEQDDAVQDITEHDTEMRFPAVATPSDSYAEPQEPTGYLEPPAPDITAQINLSEITQGAWGRHAEDENVISVPVGAGSDQASEDVDEIRLEENDHTSVD